MTIITPGFPETNEPIPTAPPPLFTRATEQAAAIAHRGVDALRDGTQHLREKAQNASDSTLDYIRDEPVKSVLIAAAAGAALMAVATYLARTRD